MKKIISFSLSRLFVKELGTLARNVELVVKGLLSGKLIPQKLVDDLTAGIATYDRAVGKLTPSELAELAKTFDDERDSIILAIKGLVISARYRMEEAVRSAGKKIEAAIRHRGWQMQEASYAAETNEINQLLGDIAGTPELKSASTTLGSDVLFEQLGVANRKFEGNAQKRIEVEVAKGDLSSAEAVRLLESTLQTVFGYLDSVSGVYPEVAAAIDTINGTIEPLAVQIKTRATILEKKKEEDKKKNTPSTK